MFHAGARGRVIKASEARPANTLGNFNKDVMVSTGPENGDTAEDDIDNCCLLQKYRNGH